MCGIAGFNWEDKELLKKCTDILSHRGPDASGYYTSNSISLGQRRLAVIDTSDKGNQPMGNEDGTLWINYNGEVYNYYELREHLKEKHTFISDTDTEVILHLFEEKKEHMLSLLNGMFSLCIWDDIKKKIFIARDRFGIKPLYYYWDGKRFIFASEIKAILETGLKRELNLEALNNYLTYKFSLGPLTMFQKIYKLQPGHYLTLKNNKLSIKKWYDLSYDARVGSKNYFIKKIKKTLDEAVQKRMIADVPLGAFLSGGIDSSAIVATMSRFAEEPVRTFSMGFAEADYDELDYARKVAEQFSTEHHETVMGFDDLRTLLPRITWHLDEPFGDFAAIPTHMISEFARKKVTVALSGDGGDESFIGYRQSLFQHYGRHYLAVPKIVRTYISRTAGKVFAKTSHHAKALNSFSINHDGARSLSWNCYIDDGLKKEIYKKKMLPYIGSEKKLLSGYNEKIKNYPELHKNLYVEIKTWLPDDALFKVDKMSMMNSLEARVPFLDHELVELAASIPVRHKVQGFETKHLLKLALKDRLPREILYRKKQGFNLPTSEWFRKELKSFTQEVLFANDLQRFFKRNKLQKLFRRHLNKKEDYRYQLNTLLSFGIWYGVFIKAEDWRKL